MRPGVPMYVVNVYGHARVLTSVWVSLVREFMKGCLCEQDGCYKW